MFKRTASKIRKTWGAYTKLREVKVISAHFSNYLHPMLALSDELKQQVYRIRHNVYCEELGFEKINPNGIEVDNFDNYSVHCLIQHLSSGSFAGTVRLVLPREEGQLLPLEKYCMHSISHPEFEPQHFNRDEICEISRLAVPAQFRRRQMDKYDGAATGVINEETYSETELRCFPFIAVGLYLSAASVALGMGIRHAFVMMEPRLARSMGFIGIKFVQIGPTIEYHGKRAPYYINAELLMSNLTAGFKGMLEDIQQLLEQEAQRAPLPIAPRNSKQELVKRL